MSEKNLEYSKLFTAVKEGNLEEVKKYISEDPASVNAVNSENYSVLMLAILSGKLPLVKYLLQMGANAN